MNIARYESLPAVRDIFDDLFRGFFVQPMARGSVASEGASLAPRIEVVDHNGVYKVRAELPGVRKQDINVSVDGDVLSISGERVRESENKDGERIVYSERHASKFSRSIRLGAEIELDRAEAKFNDGVLELTLPRKSAAVRQLTVH